MRITSVRLALECIAAALLMSLASGLQSISPAAGRASFSHDYVGGAIAHPRDWVRIEPGAPLTVPIGKVFVLTALGENVRVWGQSSLYVNGNSMFSSTYYAGSAPSLARHTVADARTGFVVQSGDVVSVPQPSMRAWGYVADPAAVGQPGLVVPPMSSWLNVPGPYVVPPGKILVLSGLGNLNLNSQLLIDGVEQVSNLVDAVLPSLSVRTLPIGLAARAGQTVSTSSSFELIVGFLVDA